jgi:hypothetical protein
MRWTHLHDAGGSGVQLDHETADEDPRTDGECHGNFDGERPRRCPAAPWRVSWSPEQAL